MSFYSNVFDPRLVVGQIIAMQCLGYLSLSSLVWVFHEIFATNLGLSQVFGSDTLGWNSPDTAAATAAAMLNGLIIGVQLSFVVERAKKCLDFAVTFFLIHLLACWKYDAFPLDWRWWAVNVGACILASVSGEYLCMKRELREINVNEFLSVSPPLPKMQRIVTNVSKMRPVRAEHPSQLQGNPVQRRPSSRPNSPDLA